MLKSKLIKKLNEIDWEFEVTFFNVEYDHEFFKVCQYPNKKTIICLTWWGDFYEKVWKMS